jgi:hypothetical protein
VFEWGLYLDEIDVHDLSRGDNDVWVSVGDSIASAAFDRAPAHQPSFPEAVARRHAGYFPTMVRAGFGSLHHTDAVRRIDDVLSLNPDAPVIAFRSDRTTGTRSRSGRTSSESSAGCARPGGSRWWRGSHFAPTARWTTRRE